MHEKAQVVSLTSSNAGVTGGQLPAALIRVRDLAAGFFKKQLQELFATADDTLFDMADRAASNLEQGNMFEAMRALRIARNQLQHGFMQQFTLSFASLAQVPDNDRQPSAGMDFESLSLVQHDELEESVTINSMSGKVMARDADLLEDLNARFSHLLGRELELHENPLGPKRLSQQFLHDLNQFGFEAMQVKLILLKLFERSVLDDIGLLYADTNQALIESGVLPDLRSRGTVPGARPARESRTPSTAAGTDTPASSERDNRIETSFREIRTLLHDALHRQETRQAAHAVPVSTSNLLRLLTHLQQHSLQQELPGNLVRQQIDSILQRAGEQSGQPQVIAQTENDAINLVSMLFEFILEDHNLAASLRALIARLQIPMLKVAVLDQSFFESDRHPARQLLNELGTIALGWDNHDSQQRDRLYQKMESVVTRVVSDFTDDPAIFGEQLQELTTFAHNERRRSELVEQRLRATEEGRARTRLARENVEQALNERMAGKDLPATVLELLHNNWSQVLLLQYLRQGEDSSQWRHGLRVIDDLVWSLSELDSPADAERLDLLIPKLADNLRSGFDEAALDPLTTTQLLQDLEDLHTHALDHLRQQLARPPAPQETYDRAASPEPATAVAEEPTTQSVPAAAGPTERPEAPPEQDTSPATGETVQLDENDPALQQVDSLCQGSWFEFREEQDVRVRCKLSAIIRATGRYIFVNRHGMKILDKNRDELALALKSERLRLLDDALLFDRALESVISDLRRRKQN